MKTLFTVALLFMGTVCWAGDKSVMLSVCDTFYSYNKETKKLELKKGDCVKCVRTISMNDYGLGSGVSCNWEAYNKRQEEKKDGK